VVVPTEPDEKSSSEEGEFEQFEDLARKVVQVPKKEVDGKRENKQP
jgi:hypothetical protein